MKLWIDDIRSAPEDYIHCWTVPQAKWIIFASVAWNQCQFDLCEAAFQHAKELGVDIEIPEFDDLVSGDFHIELIDIDHDAGAYASHGGDYIRLLDWLEEHSRYKFDAIHIHSMNPVGAQNMRNIIQRNGWKEIFF